MSVVLLSLIILSLTFVPANGLAVDEPAVRITEFEGGKNNGSHISGSKRTKAAAEKRVEIMIGGSSADIELKKLIEVRE